jgi:hypothetical protein
MTDAASTIDHLDPAHAGQAVYTRGFLSVYDAVVYGFNSPYLWRCPKARVVAHYDANVSARHLDVGVATGALLDACCFPVPAPELTLMDLNPKSLAAASARLARYAPVTHRANVLEDWRLEPGTYDSVAMTHLVHCLHGPMSARGSPSSTPTAPSRPAAPSSARRSSARASTSRRPPAPPSRSATPAASSTTQATAPPSSTPPLPPSSRPAP